MITFMITIKFITSVGCIECDQAKTILQDVKSIFNNINIEEIDVMSQKGISMVTKYGIMANPGIIINNKLFSVGKLNKQKLLLHLKNVE